MISSALLPLEPLLWTLLVSNSATFIPELQTAMGPEDILPPPSFAVTVLHQDSIVQTQRSFLWSIFGRECTTAIGFKAQWAVCSLKWDDGAYPGVDEVESDWFSRDHLTKLRKWRNELLVQLTGEAVRDPIGDNLNKYEED